MGFLFCKRIKILPGVWFNLSKRGISTSIGGKGITINIKDDNVRTTASIPGTGISYRTTSSSSVTPDNLGILKWPVPGAFRLIAPSAAYNELHSYLSTKDVVSRLSK